MSDDILDNPVLASLRGVHRSLALVDGRVARYPGDVCPFMAVPDNVRPEEWEQLAALAGDDPVVLVNPPASVPKSWTLVNGLSALQMLGPEADHAAAVATPGWAVETLRREDAADMLELAVATQPGPFAARTGELGVYLGVRDRGKLIAMAGERLRPEGWSEISAVCTAPDYRGRGLARTLMEQLAAGIRQRGQRPFLHVMASNTGAIRLYEAMGYATRRTLTIDRYHPN
jgi:ribosomal protein S18 acetylase RimI-like enzyme